MGMDIYSEHGVVFTVGELCIRMFGKMKKGFVALAVEGINEYLCTKNKDKEFDGPLTTLKTIKTAPELVDWFVQFCESQVETEYGEGYFSTDEHMSAIFDKLCEIAEIDLPPATFEYWTRCRLNGYDVPIEEPCIVINDEKLFETKMTDAGKRVAKLLGLRKIESTTWTIMSV